MGDWGAGIRRWTRSRSGSALLAVVEATAVGLAYGIADTRISGDEGRHFLAFLAAGVALGFRHAGRAMLCWLPLGVGLYLAHVVAIARGARPPFVEENVRFSEACLFALIPAGLSLMLGALVRVSLASNGVLRREAGPPVRFLPRTTRDVLVAVACLGVGLGLLRRAAFPPTIYAPGFTEARFAQIREGMTAGQVLSILGPPLDRRPWGEGVEAWRYSNQYTYTSDFDRRWLFLRDGVVQSIANDYWWD
ncbi:hypothetical protein OJF2_08100 [Aquisphaera giovannonii]|uniref:Lipoprotein SmpA/OmlA domain-containing protein n=1 Tax=Aquisphaera giovannonii TaxID=406548 RepID=A0A5B9VXA7_9BACT|nr:outer membrane protein assembly factor BamE [Aquisphaera giovannonii]QEH32340.1 hypothetical protein OJF2_08100 [Aquisphaera giovannonii]